MDGLDDIVLHINSDAKIENDINKSIVKRFNTKNKKIINDFLKEKTKTELDKQKPKLTKEEMSNFGNTNLGTYKNKIFTPNDVVNDFKNKINLFTKENNINKDEVILQVQSSKYNFGLGLKKKTDKSTKRHSNIVSYYNEIVYPLERELKQKLVDYTTEKLNEYTKLEPIKY
jgi:hypothetical protein